MTEPPIVPGRSCGSCTLCCKVLRITELRKPQGKWCQHCKPGLGCRIYENRPDECRTFHCGWLHSDAVPDEWQPLKSRMVIVAEMDGNRVAVHVDPGRPDVWRREPYYSDLKRWAMAAAPDCGQVVVSILTRAIVILPERDVDLGPIADEELIVTAERRTPFGVALDAFKIRKDDPRASLVRPPGRPAH